MKFLDVPALASLTQLLTNCEVGDKILNGRVEAFSCKMAGEDKRLSRQLRTQYKAELSREESSSSGVAPLGGSPQPKRRRTEDPQQPQEATSEHDGNSGAQGKAEAVGAEDSITATSTNTAPTGAALSAIAAANPGEASVEADVNHQNDDFLGKTTHEVRLSRSQSMESQGLLDEAQHPAGAELAVGDAPPSSLRSRFSQPRVQRLMINLIATLNALYPDFDFSSAGPDRWIQHQSHKHVMPAINKHLARVVESRYAEFLEQLWKAIYECINVPECQVYSYLPQDGDPFSSSGILWSFNYFFYNPTLNRVLSFVCVASSNYNRGGMSPSIHSGVFESHPSSQPPTPTLYRDSNNRSPGASSYEAQPTRMRRTGRAPRLHRIAHLRDGDEDDDDDDDYGDSSGGGGVTSRYDDDDDIDNENDMEAYDVTEHFDDDEDTHESSTGGAGSRQ